MNNKIIKNIVELITLILLVWFVIVGIGGLSVILASISSYALTVFYWIILFGILYLIIMFFKKYLM